MKENCFLSGKQPFKFNHPSSYCRENLFFNTGKKKQYLRFFSYSGAFSYFFIPILILAVSFITFGCSGSDKNIRTEEQVYATVNGTTLTESELKTIVPQDFYDRLTTEHKKKIVEDWVQKELLYQEALKDGIDKDIEIARLIKITEKNLLSNEFLERELSEIKIPTEQELETFYNQRKDYFEIDTEEYKVRYALFDTIDDATSFHDQVKKNQSFSDLAKNMSKDSSAKNGGDLGIINEESVDPSVWDAVKATVKKYGLKKISDPFTVNDGWGCLIVDEVLPVGTIKPFISVRSFVEDLYMNEKRENAKNELMKKLTQKAKIKYETFE